MIGRELAALVERPIPERHRSRVFAIVAAALLGAALALTLTAPDDRGGLGSANRRGAQFADERVVPIPTRPRPPASAPAAVRSAARRFLEGYLTYLHGRASVGAIEAVGRELRHGLAASRPRVSPATRRRRPRLIELDGYALRRGRWLITATVADGGVADYAVTVIVADRPGGLVATRIGGD